MNDLKHKINTDNSHSKSGLDFSLDEKSDSDKEAKKSADSLNDKSTTAKIEARQLIRQAQAVYKSKKKAGFKNKAEEVKAETLAQLVLSLDNVIKSLDKISK